MGHKLNQKNIMRTPEEKEKIILEYINDKRSFSELGSKYLTIRNVIRKWIRRFKIRNRQKNWR